MSPRREIISLPVRPPVVASGSGRPVSMAVRGGDFLFVSGQIPLDPATGALVEGDVAAQTHRVLRNLGAILQEAGASFQHVVKTTVYLADMSEFGAMNEVYGTYFNSPAPARAPTTR